MTKTKKFIPDMTDPKLVATLVKLQAANEKVRANPPQYNPRARAAREAENKFQIAFVERQEAMVALCRVLQKQRDPSVVDD
jgi:hypothetical protein